MTNWTLPKAAQLYKKTHACNRQALPEQAQFCEKNTLLQQAGFAGAGAASRKNTRLLQTPFAGAARPCWKIFALHQGPPCRKAEGGASPALLQRLLISCRKAFLPSQAGKSVISTFEHAALSRGCGGIAFAPAAPGVSAAEKKGPASQRHVGPSERFMRQNSKTELLFSADTPALPSFFHAAGGYNVRPCAQHVGHYHLPGLHRGLQPHLVQKADGLKQQALGDRRAGLYRAGAGEGRLPPLRCW